MVQTPTFDLVIATGNSGKVVEIRTLLGNAQLNFRSLSEFPEIRSVEESGSTYEENAVLKATAYARQTGLWALADDSGLEVDALNGAPGLYSARYAGENASDSDRVAFLLQELESLKNMNRDACFVCVAALADSTSAVRKIGYGICEGRLTDRPKGASGFGYDPIFIPQGYEKTFAELPPDIKNVISHRARAMWAVRSFLDSMLNESGA
jgi:XTP/dITP diphosphohydrolase